MTAGSNHLIGLHTKRKKFLLQSRNLLWMIIRVQWTDGNLQFFVYQGLRWQGFKGFGRIRCFLNEVLEPVNFWPIKPNNQQFGGLYEV